MIRRKSTSLYSPVSAVNWDRIEHGWIHSSDPFERLLSEAQYRASDAIIEQYLEARSILPRSLRDVVAAGIGALSEELIEVRSPADVAQDISTAVEKRIGYALVRLGDGELLTLAQSTVLNDEQVAEVGGNFLLYAGVNVPDHKARDMLCESVLQADVVGVPLQRTATFQLLFHALARHFEWPLKSMQWTSSLINYQLHEQTNLYSSLLASYSVVLIGNCMERLHPHLQSLGYHRISGAIPVSGVHSVDDVMARLSHLEFDVALVSAGIGANILCPRIRRLGKVAIDFGHLADRLLQGNVSL